MNRSFLAGASVALAFFVTAAQAQMLPPDRPKRQPKPANAAMQAAKQGAGASFDAGKPLPAEIYNRIWQRAQVHFAASVKATPEPQRYPRSTRPDGGLVWVRSDDWTSGFYPGSLWFLFNNKPDELWLREAKVRTEALEREKYNSRTHDLGFMMYIPYGAGMNLLGADQASTKAAYKNILIQTARTLCTRYSPKTKTIKSWDFSGPGKVWQWPVIIDNMMNLELLFWAHKVTGEAYFKDVALNHANTTLANHFREDNSSFHVVDYDSTNGSVRWRGTHQGYADGSAWARGQAWGFYGYTVMYRETKDPRYLAQAQKIGGYIFGSKTLPADLVPFWDHNAPDIPNTARDASAAAIAASALVELSQMVPEPTRTDYLKKARTIINTLASPAFMAEPGTNNNFLLMHSTGHKPGNSEIDVPLNYADYYLLEAITRLQRLETGKDPVKW